MSSLAARAVDLAMQEPAVIRARLGRPASMVVQTAILIALLWVRPFDGYVNASLLVVVEILLIGLLLIRVALAVRSVRARNREWSNPVLSLREIVFAICPAPIAHIFMSEMTIWIGLWRLVSRPFRSRQPEFSYHRRSADYGMLLVVIVTAPVEILLIELLVPWPTVRWFLLAVAVYSVLWFVGVTIVPMVNPHVARARHLILRNGAATYVPVRFANIVAIESFVTAWPGVSGRFPPPLVIRDGIAYLQAGERSSVRLQLCEPQDVTVDSSAEPVTSIVIAVDDPEAMIAAVEASIGSLPGSS